MARLAADPPFALLLAPSWLGRFDDVAGGRLGVSMDRTQPPFHITPSTERNRERL